MTGTQLIQQLAPLLGAVPLPLWVIDHQGRLLAASDSFRQLCGGVERLQDVLQRPEVVDQLLQAPSGTGGEPVVETTIACGPQQGSRITLQATSGEIAGEQIAVGWLGLPEDESHKPEWLINQIAHALRNPIFAASVQSEAISLRTMQAPEIGKPVGILFKQLKRLEATIDEMLLLGRPVKVVLQEVDVSQLFGSIADSFRQGKRGEPAEVRLTISPADLRARWDARGVQIAIERIMDNAVQQTDEPHRIELSARQQGDEVIVTVRDEGNGMPEEIRERIFLPFFPQHRGRPGLGMSIARKYVRAIGGRVEIDSEPRQGTEVRCIYPLTAEVAGSTVI